MSGCVVFRRNQGACFIVSNEIEPIFFKDKYDTNAKLGNVINKRKYIYRSPKKQMKGKERKV